MILLTQEELRIARERRHAFWLEEYRREQRKTVWLGLFYWGIWVATLAALAAAVWRG